MPGRDQPRSPRRRESLPRPGRRSGRFDGMSARGRRRLRPYVAVSRRRRGNLRGHAPGEERTFALRGLMSHRQFPLLPGSRLERAPSSWPRGCCRAPPLPRRAGHGMSRGWPELPPGPARVLLRHCLEIVAFEPGDHLTFLHETPFLNAEPDEPPRAFGVPRRPCAGRRRSRCR